MFLLKSFKKIWIGRRCTTAPERTADLSSAVPMTTFTFIAHTIWFATIILTCMLDSLVRVTRRDVDCRFINISGQRYRWTDQVDLRSVTQALQLPTVLECCQSATQPLPRISARGVSIPHSGEAEWFHRAVTSAPNSSRNRRAKVQHLMAFFSTPQVMLIGNTATIKNGSKTTLTKH